MAIFSKKHKTKILELSNSQFTTKLKKTDEISVALNHIQETLENNFNEKMDMASNLSHELKTPLAALMALCENLADRIIEPTPIILEQMLNHSEKMDERISFMLNLTNISTNHANLNITTFELRDFLDKIVNDCKLSVKDKTFVFRIDIKPSNLCVTADKNRISEVIENLVNNAIKYSFNETEIVLHCYQDKKNIIINVINEGEKIEHKSQVFNRFFTKNSTSSGGGTGIGLAISKWIVKLHNGSIVCLEEDSKTIFRITLPIPA